MTWAGRVASLIPLFLASIVLAAVVRFVIAPDALSLACLPLAIYVLPVFLFRLHNLFFPLLEGTVDITKPVYNPWWTSHQLQMLYIAMPVLEAPLHFVPGLFSFWLRLWGSRIGKDVYWTPRVEILDRSLLVVGNGVIVGHLAGFSSHVITPKDGRATLLIKKIHLGSGSFIGAEARIGPGTVIEPKQMVRHRTVMTWKGVIS